MTYAPNACVTGIIHVHSSLVRLQVRLDDGPLKWQPGQYTFLGLDGEQVRQAAAGGSGSGSGSGSGGETHGEDDFDQGETVRRPFSISSAILSADGDRLLTPEDPELEFYLRTDEGPFGAALGRLQPGNPLIVGPEVGGHCTLDPVPLEADVLLIATGTGEAPHNALVAALLARGQKGRVATVVSCRESRDMGYADVHRRLAAAWQGYSHFSFATREGAHAGRHLQDLLWDGTLAAATGVRLEPGAVHVFLCGNPAMIGRPHREQGRWVYPPGPGMAELLARQHGLQPDCATAPGAIHFERYS